MLKRTFVKLVMAGALASALPTLTYAQSTTVRMWTFLNPTGKAPREVALAQIIKSYEAANPGTRIVVETQPFDQMTPKFLAAHGARNAPDIIWAIPDFLGDAVKSGSLADLNPLIISRWTPQQVQDRAGAHWDLTNIGG